MKRNAIQDLIRWKSSEERKPMVLKGARQVGKTWVMKEFGENFYDSYVYQFKGPLTENYVLQQLRGRFSVEPRYYADKNSEIDFVLQNGTEIIPIEAKGGEDKPAPSFKRYVSEKQPEHAIRFSKRGYMKNGLITNVPLYLVRKTKELL